MSVKASNKRKKRKITFFFWEGKLHKVLRISYPQNLVEAWCFSERQSVAMLYTDWRRNAGRALMTGEMLKLMNCSRATMHNAMKNLEFRPPEYSYPLDGTFSKDRGRMWWSEKHVLELHSALLSHHIGRPRNDGKSTPLSKLPTEAQIKAFFRNEETLYIQTDDGRMVPVFEAQRW